MTREDMRAIAINLLASLIFFLCGWLLSTIAPSNFWDEKINISYTYYSIAVFIVVTLIVLWLACIIFQIVFSKIDIYEGRECVMGKNVSLVERYLTNRRRVFRSTRVTYWTIPENSINRTRFRQLITEKIIDGYETKRLWQIQSATDLDALHKYLDQYKDFDHYSVRAICNKSVMIPELIIVGGKAASVSFPEPLSPRKISCSMHIFSKRGVLSVSRYFDVLWDMAIPIKSGAEILNNNIQNIKKIIEEGL